MPNPINSRDLLDPQALDEIISKFEAASKQIGVSMDKIIKKAGELEKELKKVDFTTEKGKETLKQSGSEIEKLKVAQDKYKETLTENAKAIAALKEQQKEQNRINRLTVKVNKAAEGSYNKLSAQYSLLKIRLNAMSKAERFATKEGQKLEKQSRELFQEMKRLQELTGKHTLSVGDYGKALRQIPGPLGRWINNLETQRKELKAGVKGLGGFINGLKLTKVALISTGIGAFVVLLGTLAAAFLKTQRGIDLMERGLSAISATMNVLIERGGRLFTTITNIFNQPFSKTIEQVGEAIGGVTDEMKREAATAASLTKQLQGVKRERARLRVESKKDRAEIKRLGLISEDISKQPAERAEAARKAFEIENGLRAKNERLLQKEVDILDQRAKSANALFSDEQALADKKVELAQFQEESLERSTTLNNRLQQINKQAATAEKERKDQIKELVDEVAVANAKIQGPAAVARLEYDKAIAKIQELKKEAASLGQDLDFSSLELLEEAKLIRSFDAILGDPATIQSGAERFGKDTSLSYESGLKEGLDKGVPETFLETINKAQEKVNESVDGSTFAEKLFSDIEAGGLEGGLLNLLGLDLNEGELAGVKTTFDFVKNQMTQLFNQRLQLANQNLSLANTEIASAERVLQSEIANRNAGFAHKVTTAQRELQEARKRQRQALKEQEKAQKAQLAIQSIQEASNLAGAASKIFFQVGNPLVALPLISLMFATFVGAKLKAFSLAKKQFAQGGYEELNYGGSHSSGNDISLGMMADGKTERRVERGESIGIFNKRSVQKYSSILPDLVNAANRMDLEKYLNMNTHYVKEVPLFVNNSTVNTKVMERELAEIRKQGGVRYFTNSQGQLVRIRGNITTTYI